MKTLNPFFLIFLLFFLFCFFSCLSSSGLRESIDFEYFSLAEEYYILKKWDKALEFYSKSKQSEKFYTSSMYKSGLILIEQKKYLEAELRFQELLLKDDENTSLLSYLAFVKAKQNKFSEAISLYEKVLLLHPFSQNTKKNLALVHWYAGNKEIAIQIQNELLEENPLDLSLKNILKEEESKKKKNEDLDLELIQNEDANVELFPDDKA